MGRRTVLRESVLEVSGVQIQKCIRSDIALLCRYIIRVFQWARKYGLRVNLALYAVPGSQNGKTKSTFFALFPRSDDSNVGFNNSGRLGSINFLYGVMGIANAQRTLDYIRIITEFISQPEWTAVVPMFTVLNEPEQVQHIGNSTMLSL